MSNEVFIKTNISKYEIESPFLFRITQLKEFLIDIIIFIVMFNIQLNIFLNYILNKMRRNNYNWNKYGVIELLIFLL